MMAVQSTSASRCVITDLRAEYLLPVPQTTPTAAGGVGIALSSFKCASDEDELDRLGIETMIGSRRDSALEMEDPDETAKLVSRMLEIVSTEKEMLSKDAEKEQEICAVDKAIQEKEEILSKLMDTVKGYATMKSDFEKLLDAIGSLESERRYLENELEKAKKTAETSQAAGAGGANPRAIEILKERFTKVKVELNKYNIIYNK